MKKIFAFLLLALVGPSAQAGVTCSVPFNLQNGTTADATQVMANYNAIIACLGNAATAGANNDITSLAALSTPITPTQGGTNAYTGGTSTGSANAQIVASLTPSTGFSLSAGKKVIFRAGFSNAAGTTTLNVASTGVVNLYRTTNAGVVPTVGGEIIAGQMVEVLYDGTQYQITNPANNMPIGTSMDFRGSIPTGFLLEDGSCVSRTTYAALFSIIGTTYGGCSGSEFNLPNSFGRVNAAFDPTGTVLGTPSGCNATVIGQACGAQNFTIAQANLPAYTLPNTLGITDPGHDHSGLQTVSSYGVGGVGALQAGGSGTVSANTTGISISGSITSGGSGTAQVGLPPLMVTVRAIKY